MNRKLLLLFALCLGWLEVLIFRLSQNKPISFVMVLLIFMVVELLFIIISLKKQVQSNHMRLMKNLAVIITGMTIQHFLLYSLPMVVHYIFLSINLMVLLYMSLLIFSEFRCEGEKQVDLIRTIQSCGSILLVDISVVLLFKGLDAIANQMLDSSIMLLVVCCYIWNFNSKDMSQEN